MSKMRCKVAGRLALLRLGEGKEAGEGAGEEEEVPEEVEVIVGELIEGLGHSVRLLSSSSLRFPSRFRFSTVHPQLPTQLLTDPSSPSQDTIPRYSSAKYLARLCSSLPPSFASQITDAVLSNLEEALIEANEQGLADRAEGKVQGACLAVGEMARRGLLGQGEEREEQVRRVVDGVLQVRCHLFIL
jgi:hypothetical protein